MSSRAANSPAPRTAPIGSGIEGVLLIGHGTRDPQGTRQFFELGDRLAKRLHPVPVEVALLEFQRPTIAEAWQKLAAYGVSHVHVAPLLLFAAGHAKADIPEMIAACQVQTPEISSDQCRPISRARPIVDLALKRLHTALDPLSLPRSRVAVLMVGRGSYDPCAQADMRVLAEVMGSRIDAGSVTTAFYAMAEPNVPDQIDLLATSGRYDAVIVQPHLLFNGRLYEAIERQTAAAAGRYPRVQFVVSDYLGPEPEVAEAIAVRLFADQG